MIEHENEIPKTGWVRSTKSEAQYLTLGVRATAYVAIVTHNSPHLDHHGSLVVGVAEGDPVPFASYKGPGQSPIEKLPDELAQVCWQYAQKDAPAGKTPAPICSKTGCAQRAIYSPVLLIVSKINPRAVAEGSFSNLAMCAAHASTTTVDDLVNNIGWQQILNRFVKQGLAKPTRALTRLDFREIA